MNKTKIIAHRGGALEHPEHSWSAFESCMKESSINGIEFDIQFTEDNIPIIVHDMTITIQKNTYVIANTYYQELKDHVISFQELLNFVQGKKQLYIEIKGSPSNEQISKIIQQINEYKLLYDYQTIQPLFIIMSFNYKLIKKLSNFFPATQLCFISACLYDHTILNEIWKQTAFSNIALSVDCISSEFLMVLRHMNISIFLYTLNEPKLYDYIKHKYPHILIDSIISDCPKKIEQQIKNHLIPE
jgi:glycerophosphoryl diester phosphodiesterase